MNKDLRMKIEQLQVELEEIRLQMEEHKELIEKLQRGEQKYYNIMPKDMQSGEYGEKAKTAVSELGEAADAVQEAMNALEDAMFNLNNAVE